MYFIEGIQGGDSFATNYNETLSVNTRLKRQATRRHHKGSGPKNLTSDSSFKHVAQPCPLWRPWGPAKYHYKNHPLHLMVYSIL